MSNQHRTKPWNINVYYKPTSIWQGQKLMEDESYQSNQ